MSDKEKRDRALQRRVRERQVKTGESYQAAWRQLTDSEAPSSSELPQRADTHDAPTNIGRIPLSLGTNVKILHGQSAQITARHQLESFWPDRLLIKNADRWEIHRLTVGRGKGPYSQLIETGTRPASEFSLDVWHPLRTCEVPCGEEIVAVVSYTGNNEQGEGFEATLFGWEACPPTKPTEHHAKDDSERVSERAESKHVRANEMVRLPLTITSPALFVDRFTITDAKDWVINDIRTRGKSIFVQAGDLPGEMFSASARVILEPLAADNRVEIVATYVGNKTSACLMVELSGTAKPTNAQRPVSYFLPLSTDIPILPTQSAQITARTQMNFLPERMVIADQDDWIVNDIRVGVRCQLASSGDLPGQSFSSRTVGGHVTFDPVRVGQDFIIVTSRGEDCEKSAGFYCGLQGRLVQALKQRTERDTTRSDEPSSSLLVSSENENSPNSSSRLVIPLHLPRVQPRQPTRVATRAEQGAIDIEGIYISGAGTLGGTADWVVNDIEIDGRSQLTHKDLPGALFGGSGVAAAKRAATKLSLAGFDPVERDRELVLVVTYVGPNPEGVPFFASAVGSKPQQRPTIVPIASKSLLLPTAKTTITARVQNAPFEMVRMEIGDEGTEGGAADWIVGDLRINGRSQFVQSGDIPGDLFSIKAVDTFVKLETCADGSTIELDMIYIGLNERGAIFTAHLEGTVLRDDYSVAPPDLHVLVETSGQGPGDTVIATCNWRAPATDNRTR